MNELNKETLRERIRTILETNNIRRGHKRCEGQFIGRVRCDDACYSQSGYFYISVSIHICGLSKHMSNTKEIKNVIIELKKIKDELGADYTLEKDLYQDGDIHFQMICIYMRVKYDVYKELQNQYNYDLAISQKSRDLISGQVIYHIFNYDRPISNLIKNIYRQDMCYWLEYAKKNKQQIIDILSSDNYYKQHFTIKETNDNKLALILNRDIDKEKQLCIDNRNKQLNQQENKINRLKKRRTTLNNYILRYNDELQTLEQQIKIEEQIYENMSNV